MQHTDGAVGSHRRLYQILVVSRRPRAESDDIYDELSVEGEMDQAFWHSHHPCSAGPSYRVTLTLGTQTSIRENHYSAPHH